MAETPPTGPSDEAYRQAEAAAPAGTSPEQIARGAQLFQELFDAYDGPEFPEAPPATGSNPTN